MTTNTKKAYQKALNHLEDRINLTKSLDEVNKLLTQYNLALLHPYSHGIEISHLKKILEENNNPYEEISLYFGKRFFNLTYTIDLIEGFFSFRPFIKEYIPSIKESVILCLQKDFNASVYTIIPVIEGVLRNFLIEDSDSNSFKTTTKVSELLKAFNRLTCRYLLIQEENLTKKGFERNQVKNIKKKHEEYFTLWISQLKTYLANNLYLSTEYNEIHDNLNRHVIFHSFEKNIEFGFLDYIRLFHCISYLSWAIGLVSEECSVFNVAEISIVKKEWSNFMSVLYVSEATTSLKSKAYNKKIESFKKYLSSEYIKVISRPENKIKEIINQFDMEKYLTLS
jgi:hypothetical protein